MRRAFLSLAFLVGCSSPAANDRVDPIGPDPKDFDAVVGALDRRCGSLDCHGSRYRNLRVYGYGGLRLDPANNPETPKIATPAEVTATYEGVISVEPEKMRAVALTKGDGLDELLVVRKARGSEAHKGGAPIFPGDDADICVVGWFRGAVDRSACDRAAGEP